MRSVAMQPQKVVVFVFVVFVVVFGCLGPVLPSYSLQPAPVLPALLLLLLQQNNKCGSATRAVAWLNEHACVCVCVRRNERTGFASRLPLLACSLLASVRFGLVSLLRSFGRRRRSSRRHHGASLALALLLALSPLSLFTQIMAFAKLDPVSSSSAPLSVLLLLLLLALLV